MASFVRDILQSHDPVGIRDGKLTPRSYLMVEVTHRLFTEDDLRLVGKLYAPEAFWSSALGRATMDVPGDREFLPTETIFWNSMQPLPPLSKKLWFFDVMESDRTLQDPHLLRMCYTYGPDSSWTQVPCQASDDLTSQPIRVVEMFAGGFGGWKASWDVIAKAVKSTVHTLAIEQDVDIAKNYAISHSAKFVPREADLGLYSFHEGNWILQKTIGDDELNPVLAAYQPHVVSISSPCPPWSSAGTAPGLDSTDGLLLPKALMHLRWARPTVVLLEQVAGIKRHPHFAVIIDVMKMLGYTVVWHKVIDLSQQAQPARPRWLALALRIRAEVHICPFQMWPNQVAWEACRLHLTGSTLEALKPVQEVLAIAGNFRFVKNPAPAMNRTQEAVLELRTYDDGDQLPVFMARYGSQHAFSEQYLAEYGYFGCFLREPAFEAGRRFFAPAEIAVMHGVWDHTYLPLSNTDAWLIAGNQISVPHALLLTGNACRFLGIDLEIAELFKCYHEHKLVASQAAMHDMPGGYMIAHHDASFHETFHEAVADLLGHNAFAPTEFWTPAHGICNAAPLAGLAHDMPATAVSQQTVSEDEELTSGSPLLKAHIQLDESHQEFWFSPALTVKDLEWIWENCFGSCFDVTAIPALRLMRTPDMPSPDPSRPRVLVTSIEGVITILSSDPERYIREQSYELGIPVEIHDCFGQIGLYHAPQAEHALMDFAIATHLSLGSQFFWFVLSPQLNRSGFGILALTSFMSN
eukprot:Skav200038  [mRNA]  locus=scaffold337:123643:125889:+ [translate_table: standard]